MNKSPHKNHVNVWLRDKWVLGLCFLFTFILFGNGIGGDFVFDDHFVITGNPLIENPENIPGIFGSPYHYKQPETGLYRPLTIFSYALNKIVFGQSPTSFHMINILLHGLTSFFLFKLFLFFTERKVAFLSALLFIFSPIHIEAVTSIIGRAEILATLFVVLAIIAAMKGRQYWSLSYFSIALLSKETAVAFIPIWVFILWRYKEEKLRFLVEKLWPYSMVLIGYFGLRYAVLGSYIFSAETHVTYNPIKYLPFFEGLWTAFKVTLMYVSKIVLPITFSSDYSYNQIPTVKNIFTSWQSLAGVSIISAFSYILYKYRLAGFAAILFLAPFFVVSNLIFKTGTIMAERLMYMPSIGFALLLSMGIYYLLQKNNIVKKITYMGLSLLLLFYSYQVITRNRDWLTEDRLFASAYKVAPASIVNKTNQAYLYMKNNELDKAKQEIDSVLAIQPEHLGGLHLAGRIYQLRGDIDTAYGFWSKALKIKPNYMRAIINMGQIEYESGQYEKAEKTLTQAIEFNSRWNEVFLLAMTKTKLKKYDESINIIFQYFGENPENNNLKFALGLAYYRKGDWQKAQFYFDQSRNPEVSEEEFIKALESL